MHIRIVYNGRRLVTDAHYPPLMFAKVRRLPKMGSRHGTAERPGEGAST
jgi:hypothetical protein